MSRPLTRGQQGNRSSSTSPRRDSTDSDGIANEPRSANYASPPPTHQHAQSTFFAPAVTKLRSAHDRNASVDFSNLSLQTQPAASGGIPPLGSQKKNRSNIVNGALAPLVHSPLNRSSLVGGMSGQRAFGDMSPEPQSIDSPNGSMSERDRSGSSATAPVERSKTLHGSSSMRSLSPLRSRPSMIVGGGGQQKAQASPSSAAPLASFAHLSLHSAPLTLAPSSAPLGATAVPHSTGLIVALHVSGELFLTSPETLLKVAQLEGTPPPNREVSILQWIGEDALLKHKEAQMDARANSGQQQNFLAKQRSRAGDSSCEPSPRGPAPSSSPAMTSIQLTPPGGLTSTVHSGSCGDSDCSASSTFHAPTYSYFLDRSPTAFPLVLDYLRSGAGNMRHALTTVAEGVLHALQVEADHFALGVLSSLVASETRSRSQSKHLSQDDQFWANVVEMIDVVFPADTSAQLALGNLGLPLLASALSPTKSSSHDRTVSAALGGPSSPSLLGSGQFGRQMQHNINKMLRRLAFQQDPLLRVCHATYRNTPPADYAERLLEILHTNCTLCARKIYYKPIGLREGRDTGCPVHPVGTQWDRKNRLWPCCGSPDFNNSGCQFTGIHYTTWTFWSTD